MLLQGTSSSSTESEGSVLTLDHIQTAERLSQECRAEGGYLQRLAQLSEACVNNNAGDEPDSSQPLDKPGDSDRSDDGEEKTNLSEEEQQAVDAVKATFVKLYS